MSDLSQKDFRGVPNTCTARKIIGCTQRAFHEQATIATAANTYLVGGCPCAHVGAVQDVVVYLSAAMASGESMTVDVLQNGTSIVGGAKTINTASGTEIHLPIAAGAMLSKGDKLTVSRVYTAGGTPAAPVNSVVVEWAD